MDLLLGGTAWPERRRFRAVGGGGGGGARLPSGSELNVQARVFFFNMRKAAIFVCGTEDMEYSGSNMRRAAKQIPCRPFFLYLCMTIFRSDPANSRLFYRFRRDAVSARDALTICLVAGRFMHFFIP